MNLAANIGKDTVPLPAIDKESRTPIYAQVADSLTQMMRAGTLLPNDRLPTEYRMASQLKVNRLTVRRAYRDLRDRKILVQHRGRGTFVAADAADALGIPHRRRLESVAFVLGAADLASVPSPYRELCHDHLEGLYSVFGPLGVQVRILSGLKRDDAAYVDTFDGVIFSYLVFDPKLLRELMYRATPIISLLTARPANPLLDGMMPNVGYDRAQAVRLLGEHLIDCGYRRLGYVGTLRDSTGDLYAKFRTFLGLLLDTGLPIMAGDMVHSSHTPGATYSSVRKLIKNNNLPEAFLVDTDYNAIETIQALKDDGIRVPDDVGVVGYDDVMEASTCDPPLTTVRVPRREMGRRAAELLLEWPDDDAVPQDIVLTPQLVVRQSTRRIR